MRYSSRQAFSTQALNPALGPGTYTPRASSTSAYKRPADITISDTERRQISTSFSCSRRAESCDAGPATYAPRELKPHGQRLTLTNRYSNPALVWSPAACGYDREIAQLPDPQRYQSVRRRRRAARKPKTDSGSGSLTNSAGSLQQTTTPGPGAYNIANSADSTRKQRAASINAFDRHMFLYLSNNPFIKEAGRALQEQRAYSIQAPKANAQSGFAHGRAAWQSKFSNEGWQSAAQAPNAEPKRSCAGRGFRRRRADVGKSSELFAEAEQ